MRIEQNMFIYIKERTSWIYIDVLYIYIYIYWHTIYKYMHRERYIAAQTALKITQPRHGDRVWCHFLRQGGCAP